MKYRDDEARRIAGLPNLYSCYRRCRRNKRRTVNALKFEQDAEQNLICLQRELLNGTYQPSSSLAFMLHKPKQREIFAADFRDRVVHHVLITELEPLWERRFIYDSYACRRGKGNLAAVKRLQTFTRRASSNSTKPAWYLQLDVKSYFVSINHHILYKRLEPTIKHPLLQYITQTILHQDLTKDCRIKGARREDFLALPARKTLFKSPPHKGLPIGNLTSQFFGNVYLDALDQFVKHTLKVRWYVRYCDDFVLLADSPEQLRVWKQQIAVFLHHTLDLELHDTVKLRPIGDGIDFLGYIVRPEYLLARRRVIASLRDRLYTAHQQLKQAGLNSRSFQTYPYDWHLMATIYGWLNAYQGHLKHTAHYRAWQRLKQRYSWIDEYFVFDKGVTDYRYPPLPACDTITRQILIARNKLPGHTLLVQVGSWWCVIDSDSDTFRSSRRIPASRVELYAANLQKSGHNVALIAETGQRTTRINDRQLVRRLPACPPEPKQKQYQQLSLF